MLLSFSVLTLLAGVIHAQFPSPPSGLEVIVSTLNPDVKLSYKQVSAGELALGHYPNYFPRFSQSFARLLRA